MDIKNLRSISMRKMFLLKYEMTVQFYDYDNTYGEYETRKICVILRKWNLCGYCSLA